MEPPYFYFALLIGASRSDTQALLLLGSKNFYRLDLTQQCIRICRATCLKRIVWVLQITPRSWKIWTSSCVFGTKLPVILNSEDSIKRTNMDNYNSKMPKERLEHFSELILVIILVQSSRTSETRRPVRSKWGLQRRQIRFALTSAVIPLISLEAFQVEDTSHHNSILWFLNVLVCSTEFVRDRVCCAYFPL